jgi:hypothetical protein
MVLEVRNCGYDGRQWAGVAGEGIPASIDSGRQGGLDFCDQHVGLATPVNDSGVSAGATVHHDGRPGHRPVVYS